MGGVGNVKAAFATAVQHHAHGRMPQAEASCRTILAATPRYSPAMVLLAVVLCLNGRPEARAEAIALLRRALAINPKDAQALEILGDAFSVEHRLDEAITCFRQAIPLARGRAKLHSKLGIALNESGHHAEAIEALRRAVACDADAAQSHFNLGVALKDAGRLEAAAEAYRRAIELRPHHRDAYVNLGVIQQQLGRTDLALECYTAARRLGASSAPLCVNLANCLVKNGDPAAALEILAQVLARDAVYVDAHVVRGEALLAMDRPDDAMAAFEQALALDSTSVTAQVNLGVTLEQINRCEEAVTAERKALSLAPMNVSAHVNHGVALLRLDRFDEAIACFQQALTLDPCNAKALSNLGNAYERLGRGDLSLDLLRRAAALAPKSGKIRFNLAVNLLRHGEFSRGWDEYEWRWRGGVRGLKAPELPQPLWQGEELAGRTLLVRCEQGLGDTLQFSRYLPRLTRAGARVILAAPASLERLMRSSFPDVTVIGDDTPPPAFDFHIPLMSLPRLFKTDLGSIPSNVPYLSADPAAVARWRHRLGAGPELRVGVVWSGNPNHQYDKQRSIAAAGLLPKLIGPGVRLYSLQKDIRSEDEAALTELPTAIVDLAPQLDDMADTAAALCALDLLIAVDTSVVHLAGALAKPVWILLPAVPDWRWLWEREDSPWYPTARLYRQTRRNDWTEVLMRLSADLPREADRRATNVAAAATA